MKPLIHSFLVGFAYSLALAGPLCGQDYDPPPANLPSDEAMKQIAAKGERLAQALADPKDLTRRALAAKSAGVPDAAERLAELALAAAGL